MATRKKSYLWDRVFLADGQPVVCCHWCGRPMHSREATIDHVLPLSNGGTNDHENMVLACGSCNAQRNREQQRQDRSLMKAVRREGSNKGLRKRCWRRHKRRP